MSKRSVIILLIIIVLVIGGVLAFYFFGGRKAEALPAAPQMRTTTAEERTYTRVIDISGYEEKLLQDVLKNKKKEKLFTRRDDIIKRLNENISDDESQILNVELNQIIIELSKLK